MANREKVTGEMGRGDEMGRRRAAAGRNPGAFDPGTREIRALTELFGGMVYPASREHALERVPPHFELEVVEGPRINVHEAIRESRRERFDELGQLISAVEDLFRREMMAARSRG